MKKYIALFRGINVGGRNILPMRALVEVLEGLGLKEVKTYIQSGNVVFQSENSNTAHLAGRISAAIQESHGFTPRVLLFQVDELENAMRENPYPEAETEPKSLHLYFLAAEPENPDLTKLHSLKTETERFSLQGKVFYLHTPAGIGRSKMAAGVEKALGVPATARNWRTVNKIMAMTAKK